jgi:hypothetical protein
MLNSSDFFKKYPEFIEQDIRRHRENGVRNSYYNVNDEFMVKRISQILNNQTVKDKTILDIGSCIGTLGAWALEYGANHYTGLEVQPNFVDISKTLLAKHFFGKFNIVHESIENYQPTEQYDIVVAAGVLFGVVDVFDFCRKLTLLSKERIVIEALHPFDGLRMLLPSMVISDRRKMLEEISIIRLNDNMGMTLDRTKGNLLGFTGCEISIGSLDAIFRRLGWEQTELHLDSTSQFPEFYDCEYSNRYLVEYTYTGSSIKEFYKEYNKPNNKIKLWNGNSTIQ